MDITCQCGSVKLKTPTPKPIKLYHCHCTICQKQSASAFGTSVIFPAGDMFPLSDAMAQQLSVFERPAKREDVVVVCYFCKTCGSRIMHRDCDKKGGFHGTVVIKGGVIRGLDWSGAAHIWTSSAVVPIPPGATSFTESPPESPVNSP